MAHSMENLLVNFAIRSFRETADKDYIAARLAYRCGLYQQFLWSALHSLEKYAKCILILNKVKAPKGHSVIPSLNKMRQFGKFKPDISEESLKFIKQLEEYGAEYRYYEVSYSVEPFDIIRFDKAVWEIRRYCQPLDYNIVDTDGKSINLLALELDRIHRAKKKEEKGTCILGGTLEKILEKRGDPARGALVWNNLFWSESSRKSVKMVSTWESGNSPFFMHPEIIEEVIKYVHIPERIVEGVRQLALQREDERNKAENSH